MKLGKLQKERKLFHLLFSTACFIIVYFFSEFYLKIFAVILLIGVFIFESIKYKYREHKIFKKYLKSLFKNYEFKSITGLTWSAFASIILIFIVPKIALLFAILLEGLCDPLAYIVGKKFGTIKLIGGKTMEGSFAFLTLAIFLSNLFFYFFMQDYYILNLLWLYFISFIATLVELYSIQLDDNATVPITTALLFSILITL